MATDLKRGAFSGKETKLYYNSATHASPTWVLIDRARNIQVNDGPALSEVEFHGSKNTSNIPGYAAFSGSFEYVRRKGTDTVYDALVAARDAGSPLELQHLDGPIATVGSKGWKAPVLLGEGSSTANGGDPLVESFAFGLADAYDASDNVVEKESVTISV